MSATNACNPLARLVPGRCLVLIVDVQDRLGSAMPQREFGEVVQRIGTLLDAARLLEAEVAVTEQYPKGLGKTLAALAEKLSPRATVDEKLAFSAASAEGVRSRLASGRIDAVVIAGMEAHVCVYQTVRDLRFEGVTVHLVTDAVISRKPRDLTVGLALAERAGAVATSTETVIFDWLERAGTDAFRAASKLVR